MMKKLIMGLIMLGGFSAYGMSAGGARDVLDEVRKIVKDVDGLITELRSATTPEAEDEWQTRKDRFLAGLPGRLGKPVYDTFNEPIGDYFGSLVSEGYSPQSTIFAQIALAKKQLSGSKEKETCVFHVLAFNDDSRSHNKHKKRWVADLLDSTESILRVQKQKVEGRTIGVVPAFFNRYWKPILAIGLGAAALIGALVWGGYALKRKKAKSV